MSEKRFKVIDDDFSKWIVDTTLKEDKHEGTLYTAYDMCRKLNELFDENEQLKQKIQRWKTLYELKDKEVTARVDALNEVCEYYTSEVLFKSDTDPNRAVKEVLNEILNTEVKK